MKKYVIHTGLLTLAALASTVAFGGFHHAANALNKIPSKKHRGNIAITETSFSADELPHQEGLNLFTLGKLTTYKDLTNIKAPEHNEGVIEFSFITEDGLPANFLIRRTHLSREEFKKFTATSQAAQEYKDKKELKHLQHGHGILTGLYVQHPTISNDWKQIGSSIDDAKTYRFAPTFDLRIYPNGLIVFDLEQRSPNLIYSAGEKSAPEMLVNESTIETGGGKTASAADLLKLNID